MVLKGLNHSSKNPHDNVETLILGLPKVLTTAESKITITHNSLITPSLAEFSSVKMKIQYISSYYYNSPKSTDNCM
jgi:hypothetical protein